MDEDERREQEEREAGEALLRAFLAKEKAEKRRVHDLIEAGLAAKEDDEKEDREDGR